MFEKIKAILREYAGVDEHMIHMDSHLQADLLLNSLDVVNVIVEFEEEFGIEVDEADIRALGTVSDVVGYITAKTTQGYPVRV